MAVQAGRIQIIVMRDLIARLSGRQAPVDLSPFHVLAGTAFSCHVTHPTPQRKLSPLAPNRPPQAHAKVNGPLPHRGIGLNPYGLVNEASRDRDY